MKTPRTRAEFERNFDLLHRKIEEGKFHFAQGLSHSLDGLARVRFLPNGRIDFLSVNEMARLEANMMANMTDELLDDQFKEFKGSTTSPSEAEEGTPPVLSDGPI